MSLTCWNCDNRGGTMVRGRDGESDFDPCNECDAWSKKIALSRRSQTASQALREAGYSCSMIRETVMVAIPNRTGWAVFAVPTLNGQWNFSIRPDFSTSEIAEAQSIINKF